MGVLPFRREGEIEILARRVKVLNPAKPLPFLINTDEEVDEQTRLKYRYLDLRRERMRKNLELRHRVIKFIRDYLDSRGFIEVETPILFKTTPEGARDYLVPSRVHPGEFYALPQSRFTENLWTMMAMLPPSDRPVSFHWRLLT